MSVHSGYIEIQDPRTMGELMQFILETYPQLRRSRSYSRTNDQWKAFLAIRTKLLQSSAIKERHHIQIQASIGTGNWAKVPWIALMDSRETTTTRQGIYTIFLFSEEGSSVYLTVNQGVEWLVGGLSRSEGDPILKQKTAELRKKVGFTKHRGFLLDNAIDLESTTNLGR